MRGWQGWTESRELQWGLRETKPPRIEVRHAGTVKVGHVASDDGHSVDHGCGSDEGITVRMGIGHMKAGAAARNRGVNGDDTILECGEDPVFEPGAEDGALGGVAALDPENSDFKLENRDGREVEFGGGDAGSPAADARVGLRGFAEFGDDIRVEEEHQGGRQAGGGGSGEAARTRCPQLWERRADRRYCRVCR